MSPYIIVRMAKATKWLQAILDYEEGEVDHINCVWPVFLTFS